jgi:broad specificity phosphatase PhoE
LSKAGRRQAEALAATLAAAGVTQLVSSPSVRCHQTLTPAAERLGLEVATDPALTEGSRLKDALRLVSCHLDEDVALCSHGDVLGDLLNHYADQGAALDGDRMEKASIWVLQVEDGDVRSATYLPPPAA